MAGTPGTMMPFLYPTLLAPQALALRLPRVLRHVALNTDQRPSQQQQQQRYRHPRCRYLHNSPRHLRPTPSEDELPPLPDVTGKRSLDPSPDDYSPSIFADTAELTVIAGSGGHGCVSFLREKFIAAGPANGGDGGTGGNVYINAVPNIKSLHKIARQREIRAGSGKNGMGKSRGGQRGEDVVFEVPVGTVVREISRWDPVEEAEREWENEEIEAANARYEAKKEEKRRKFEEQVAKWDEHDQEQEVKSKAAARQQLPVTWADEEVEDYKYHYTKSSRGPDMQGFGADSEPELDDEGNVIQKRPAFDGDQRGRWRRDRWLLQPNSMPSDYVKTDFPALPRPRRSNIAATQPPAPITLDLSRPSASPVLLAAGAMGGLGNPHFATKSVPRPKFATKGNVGMRIKLRLELKLLADLGFVGMPNAGKSTLLRALSNSRARVGSWAFTTLVPNLGTVVLDDNKGRAKYEARDKEGNRLSGITVADIPGLIVGASQDRGLGLEFLRHVERAKVLAFVVDLSAGDAVESLRDLWKELDAYEKLRAQDEPVQGRGVINWGAVDMPLQSVDGKRDSRTDDDGTMMWEIGTPSTRQPRPIKPPSISSKPWFVVATKADLESTQENFASLQQYLADVSTGQREHPAGQDTRSKACRWHTAQLRAIPVSAIRGHGIERIVQCTADLLAS